MEIKRVNNFTISSKKLDACPPKYSDLIISIIIVSTLATIFLSWWVAARTPNENGLVPTLGFLASLMVFTLGFILYGSMRKCGCSISLTAPDGFILGEQTYQFTTNPDKDINEITKIIDGLEKHATRIYNERELKLKEESEAHKLCCDTYINVLGKVK